MKRLVIVVAVLLAGVGALSWLTIHQDRGWIDAISGSRKNQTTWRFGVSSSPAVAESLLAVKYRQLGLSWQPEWVNVRGAFTDIFGRSLGSSHDWPAPEIYPLVHPGLQQSYLAVASDDDVREFFRVMSGGSEAEKGVAVQAACDKALATAK
jgi:hypothetical protein